MSLLDQVIAFGADKVTAEIVAKVLGVADREVLQKLTGAMLAGDAGGALDVLGEVARQGFDMVHLWKDLMRHVRNLVVAKVCTPEQTKELLDLAAEEAADVLALAQKSDADDLTRIFTGLSRGFDDIVKSGQVRSNLEMTLVRLARRPALLPLDELLSRLGELEKRLATGAPPPARGGGGPSGGGGGTKQRADSHASATSQMPSFDAPVSVSPGTPVSVASVTSMAFTPASMTASTPFSSPLSSGGQERTSGALALAPETTAVPAPSRNAPAVEFEVKSTRVPETPPSSSRLTTNASNASIGATTPRTPAAPDAPPISMPESATLVTWRALLDRVRKVSPPVAAMLDLAVPMVVTAEKLLVGVEDESFEDTRAEQTDARTVLETEARAHFGTTTEVVFERAAKGSKVASVAYLDAAKRKQMQVEARIAVEKHSLVQQAIRVLGAELKDVKLPAQEE